MKKVFLVAFILSFGVFSAQGADLKIGYMDLNKAAMESNTGEKVDKILQDMYDNKSSILLEKEKELKNLDEELKKQSSVLTPKSIKSKKEQLAKLYKNYQRMIKDFNEEILKKQEELGQEIRKDLIEIINKIGEEEGYTIIFERGASGILYSQKEFDITEKVITRYNEIAKAKE